MQDIRHTHEVVPASDLLQLNASNVVFPSAMDTDGKNAIFVGDALPLAASGICEGAFTTVLVKIN